MLIPQTCKSALVLPNDSRVPCTRPYDHLEQHGTVCQGILLLEWGTSDTGKGLITGGILSPAFPDGYWGGPDA